MSPSHEEEVLHRVVLLGSLGLNQDSLTIFQSDGRSRLRAPFQADCVSKRLVYSRSGECLGAQKR